ncbi:MAG TPA: hypothetical protein VI564_01185 [Candidatus Nanoarchaeia archaeon]|nr:hypothetical protein [Candidatus Nanoarchaeia archaeon]
MQKNEVAENRKRRKQLIILCLIILIVIHIILNLIKISYTETAVVEVTEPYESETNKNLGDLKSVDRCYKSDYVWNYTWEGYSDNENQKIVPRFRLYNYELLPGNYYIEFGFFDESIHHYARYQGIDYEKVKDELPWNEASMQSENLTVYMEAGQSKLITASVSRKDPKVTYWTYALVTVPKRTICEKILVKDNSTKTKTETKYRTVEKEQDVTTRITLWQWLMIRLREHFS